MKHLKLHITLLLILIWSFSFSQQYTNYTSKEGLPSNHVYTIVQDAKGFIWFLTDKGMTRYNGKQFKTFTTKNGLPINDVWDALPTPNGKVWYLCKSTQLGYIENGTVFSFSSSIKDEIINPIYTSQIRDSVYPTGTQKTYKLKANKWQGETSYPHTNAEIDWIKIRHDSIKYLAFKRTGEFLYLCNKDLVITDTLNAKNIYGKTGTRGQLNDSLFFWTSNTHYSILNFNTRQLKKYKLKEHIGYALSTFPRINVVNNELQISGDGFVAKLNKNLETNNIFYFPKQLKAHFGLIDKLNNIWLATFNNGVYKLPFVKRDIQYKLQSEKIQSFNVIDSNLIVGVYKKGFYNYKPKDQSFEKNIISESYIFGAYHIKPINAKFYSSNIALLKESNFKLTALELRGFSKDLLITNELARKLVYFNDKLYGNFSFGVNIINPITFIVEKELLHKGCNDIVKFKNRLLIATTNGLKEIINDEFIPLIFENETFNKSILSLKPIDENNLLINTDGFGSYITDLQNIKLLKQTDFLIVEEAFIEDSSIWLATNSGVLRFSKNNNNQYNLKKTYTISDGLPTNDINTVYLNNKNLIVGTNNGVAILPKNKDFKSEFLDIYFEDFTYNNQNITKSNNIFDYVANNTLNVTISSLDFSEDKSNFSYNYKLEPLQNEWLSTSFRTINFNDLQPDKYTLKVKYDTFNRVQNFEVKPLWWQTLWSKLLLAILTIFVVVCISRALIKRSEFKKNQKIFEDKRLSELQLKALRSQMNPHFVFNSLAAIQYYINNNEVEASETYLVKFSKLIRQFFELSRETEISIAEEVELIKNYLDIEKLRFKDKFEYQIHLDPKLKTNQSKLPTMLLQPIIENAINHGIFNKLENGNITINFSSVNKKNIKVEIIDNGVGFVNTKKKTKRKVKSSNVLEDRLKFLNETGLWNISYTEEELHPELDDKGNKSTFTITQL